MTMHFSSTHIGAEVNFCKRMTNHTIGHVNNIPTMQFFTGIPRITQSNSYMLSLTECCWEFQNDALWDTL